MQRLLDAIGDNAESVGRLCRGCVEHLSVSGAGLSVVTGSGERATVFATDEVSAQIEELQVSLAEGPCVDAWLGRRPALEQDLSQVRRGRWPVFAPAAQAAGVAAVFSLPLQVGFTHLGALDLYRDKPGRLGGAELRDALRLGDATTKLLLRIKPAGGDALPQLAADSVVTGLEVHQATGMVMAQLYLSASDAMARLRAYAYAAERPLRDVAHDIVARRLRLDRDR